MALLRTTRTIGFLTGLIAAAAASGCDSDPAATTATSGGGQGGDGAGTTSAGGQGGAGGSAGSGGTAGSGGSGGSGPGVAAAYESGSRLRARILDGGGGAARFIDWFDSELGQRCQFLSHEDGSFRCLPVGAYLGYRDAACSDPVVYMSSCAEVPAFISQQVSVEDATCSDVGGGQASVGGAGHYRTRAVGAAAPVPPNLYFDYGDCIPIDSSIAMSYFEVGDVEPAESFIAGTIEPMAVAGGLTLEREVAADGSWSVYRLAGPDTESCLPVPLGDGYGCAPRLEASPGNHYADAACSKAVASYPAAAEGCPAPAYIPRVLPDPAGCGNFKVDLLAVGAEVDPSTVYANGGQGCGLLPPVNPARRYYTTGAPLPPDAFPALAPVPRGSGRLRMTGMEASDGTWLTPGGWGSYEGFLDSELDSGTPCEVSYFEDGTYRCTPQAYLSGSPLYYADAGCTTPLYLVAKPLNGCAPAAPPRYQTIYGGTVTCSEVPNNGTATEVRPFLPHTETIYSSAGPGCTPLGPELATAYDLYILGDPSPLDLFPTLDLRVE